jgi:hypothetical protein
MLELRKNSSVFQIAWPIFVVNILAVVGCMAESKSRTSDIRDNP